LKRELQANWWLVLAWAVLSACEPIVYEPVPAGDGDLTGDGHPQGIGVCIDVNGVRPATRGCEDVPCNIADFGEVLATRSRTKVIIVTNCASAPLNLRGLSWAPASSDAFELLEPRREGPLEPLQEGASLTVRVRYQPTDTAGDHGALVLLTDRPAQSRLIIGVRGNSSCARALTCTQGPLFSSRGPRAFGAATCTSFGTEPVEIANISLAGDTALSLRGATHATVAPGDSVRVRFTCESPTGIHTGTATVFSDACAGSIEMPVRCDVPPVAPTCSAGPFNDNALWRWHELSSGSSVDDVIAMPVVARLRDGNGNGVVDSADPPSVVFTAFPAAATFDLCHSNDPTPGILVAVNGANGLPLWSWGQLPLSIADPVATVQADSQLAAGDIDGDGWPEIVAVRFRYRGPAPGCAPKDLLCCLSGKYTTGTLLLIEHDGAFAWESEPWNLRDSTLTNAGAPALADVDGDGWPEIAFGNTLFDRFGQVRFEGTLGEGNAGVGPFSAFCDLEGDGAAELVAGNTVLRGDGTVVWHRDDISDGAAACADTHDDAQLEVILFTAGQDLLVLSPTGETKAGPVHIDNSEAEPFVSNTPAVGDIDGDGAPEIVVSSGDILYLFEHDLTEVWQLPRTASDPSGIALFDVNGDGALEILDSDTGGVDIIDATGTILMSASGNSSTTRAYPVVADLDLDGHAEILLTDDDPLGFGGDHGLVAVQPLTDDFPATRAIWSQHAHFEGVASELGEIWPSPAPAGPFHANPAWCE